jgi:hypothetical protein
LEVQLAPVAGFPFVQLHVLAWQAFPSLVKPVLQVAQIAALWEVQAAPVTAAPFEQVQVLA